MGMLEKIASVFQKQEQKPESNPMAFKNKEDAVTFVRREFEQRQKERRPIEMQWVLNMNFLNGNQYCDIQPSTQEIYQQDKMFEYQEMEVYNKIAPIVETRIAKLKQVKPTPFVRPASSETADIATAKTSKAILSGLDTTQDAQNKRALAIAWAEITGTCIFKHSWDTSLGMVIGEDEQGQVFEGDVGINVVSSFELYPENNFVNGIEGSKSLIHARAYPIEDVWERWNVAVKGENIDVFTMKHAIGAGGLGYNSAIPKFETTTVKNHAVVIEYMAIPSRRYPKGLHIIVCGNEMLHYGDFAYKVGENGRYGFPFTMQVCVDNPGFFWGKSIIERLIPVQRSYNAVKNRKHEILNRKAIGVLTAEDDGIIDLEDLETTGMYPGKIVVRAKGSAAPGFVHDGSSTQDFDAEERRLEEEFYAISGISPFASASAPPTGVVAGSALEIVKEQDDSRLSMTAENINQAAIKGYKISLRLYKQFATGPRILRYVGANNDVDVIEWMASELTSDDVIIEKESDISQTPAQRKQMVMNLLQYKLFSNDVEPKIRSKVIGLLELGNWEATDDIEELHISKAKRENKNIRKGILPEFRSFDMHDLHILEHNRDRLGTDYAQFEMQAPQLAYAHDMHIKQHEQSIMQAVQAQMMAQMPPQNDEPEAAE